MKKYKLEKLEKGNWYEICTIYNEFDDTSLEYLQANMSFEMAKEISYVGNDYENIVEWQNLSKYFDKKESLMAAITYKGMTSCFRLIEIIERPKETWHKYYAVRKGFKIGIFEDWKTVETLVKGFPGADHKSFMTYEEALDYLNDKNEKKEFVLDENSIVAYIDGSFEKSINLYSYGCVFVTSDKKIHRFNGIGNNEEALVSKNVAGELKGAMFATKYAIEKGYKRIQLNFDYEGIEKWVTDVWETKKDLTKTYKCKMQEYQEKIEIAFNKVKAHSGIEYNEIADKLAKKALEKQIITEKF